MLKHIIAKSNSRLKEAPLGAERSNHYRKTALCTLFINFNSSNARAVFTWSIPPLTGTIIDKNHHIGRWGPTLVFLQTIQDFQVGRVSSMMQNKGKNLIEWFIFFINSYINDTCISVQYAIIDVHVALFNPKVNFSEIEASFNVS